MTTLYGDARDEIVAKFEADIELVHPGLSGRVKYPNLPFSQPDSGLWCDMRLSFGASSQVEITGPADGQGTFLQPGTVTVQIRSDILGGDDAFWTLVDLIVTNFRKTTGTLVTYLVPFPITIGRDPDTEAKWRVDVSIPFQLTDTIV